MKYNEHSNTSRRGGAECTVCSSVKEVQCFGSWKEGSTFYFLGMLNDSHIRQDNYEGRFRCFAYQQIFNGFKLSQSGDARCDIWSPDEGYVTMKINKGNTMPHFF